MVSSENTPPVHSKKSAASPSTSFRSKTSSVLSELLVYPVPSQLKKRSSNSARVLTSVESLALLEEKEQAKKEQEELKIRKRKEREEKKIAREDLKLQEKERKQREKKSRQMEAISKAKSKRTKRKGSDAVVVGTKRRKVEIKVSRTSENECAVCSGQYADENGFLIDDSEWIQCTNRDCAVWTHADCLEQSNENEYICCFCQTVFT